MWKQVYCSKFMLYLIVKAQGKCLRSIPLTLWLLNWALPWKKQMLFQYWYFSFSANLWVISIIIIGSYCPFLFIIVFLIKQRLQIESLYFNLIILTLLFHSGAQFGIKLIIRKIQIFYIHGIEILNINSFMTFSNHETLWNRL